MLWDRGDQPVLWDPQENKGCEETEERRGRREVQGPVVEMVSRGPLETPGPLDRQGQTDLQASVGTLLLRWLVDLMTKLEEHRWE